MLEAYIPLSDKAKERRNLDRFDLLLHSLAFFWRGEAPLQLTIVVPDDEYTQIKIFIERYRPFARLKLRLLPEKTLSNLFGDILPGHGVMKQMLVKLSCFEHIQTDNCLLLDSDVVACRHFSEVDLIQNGKLLTEWLQPTLYEWWAESARVLGYPFDPYSLHRQRIFVTPLILSRHILQPMLQYIEQKYHAPWMVALIAEYTNVQPHIWTEYTAYDLFAEENNLMQQYHLPPGQRIPLHSLTQSIHSDEDYLRWDPRRAVDGTDPGYFLVLQSIMAHTVSFDEVRSRFRDAVRSVHGFF